MGWNATWSMAVGGMIGGGIFAVLGVVIREAGALAWLSFVIGGLIALCTAYSYAGLARNFREGGGALEFLREIHREGLAGSLSWVLILGYVLTMSVYAFIFAVVNVIAVKELDSRRWIPALGAIGAGIAAAVLTSHLLVHAPFNLLILMGTVLIAIAARPLVLRRLGVLG